MTISIASATKGAQVACREHALPATPMRHRKPAGDIACMFIERMELRAFAIFALACATLFRRLSPRLPFMVLSNDVRIGSAGFVAYDRERGVFAGPFLPEPAFETVYPVVRLLSEAYPDVSGPDARRGAVDEYLAKKDALKVELRDGEGILVPAREISILDFTVEGGADVFRIDVEAGWEEWEGRGSVAAGE